MLAYKFLGSGGSSGDGFYGRQYRVARADANKACQNGVFDAVTEECVCRLGFRGDLCDTSVCENGGAFIPGNHSCQCKHGFAGRHCEYFHCGPFGHFNATQDGCDCSSRYKGFVCDTVICDNYGVPHRDNSTRCSCTPLNSGPFCEELSLVSYALAGAAAGLFILFILCCICYLGCCRGEKKKKNERPNSLPRQAYETPISAHDETPMNSSTTAIIPPSPGNDDVTLDCTTRTRFSHCSTAGTGVAQLASRSRPSAPPASLAIDDPLQDRSDLPSYYDALDLAPSVHDTALPSAPPIYGNMSGNRRSYM